MFLDFGAREQLPALTQVMLHPVTPLAMAGTASALFAWGLTLPLQRQRVALTGVLLLALVFVGLFLIGMYLPIFQIAGAIQAE